MIKLCHGHLKVSDELFDHFLQLCIGRRRIGIDRNFIHTRLVVQRSDIAFGYKFGGIGIEGSAADLAGAAGKDFHVAIAATDLAAGDGEGAAVSNTHRVDGTAGDDTGLVGAAVGNGNIGIITDAQDTRQYRIRDRMAVQIKGKRTAGDLNSDSCFGSIKCYVLQQLEDKALVFLRRRNGCIDRFILCFVCIHLAVSVSIVPCYAGDLGGGFFCYVIQIGFAVQGCHIALCQICGGLGAKGAAGDNGTAARDLHAVIITVEDATCDGNGATVYVHAFKTTVDGAAGDGNGSAGDIHTVIITVDGAAGNVEFTVQNIHAAITTIDGTAGDGNLATADIYAVLITDKAARFIFTAIDDSDLACVNSKSHEIITANAVAVQVKGERAAVDHDNFGYVRQQLEGGVLGRLSRADRIGKGFVGSSVYLSYVGGGRLGRLGVNNCIIENVAVACKDNGAAIVQDRDRFNTRDNTVDQQKEVTIVRIHILNGSRMNTVVRDQLDVLVAFAEDNVIIGIQHHHMAITPLGRGSGANFTEFQTVYFELRLKTYISRKSVRIQLNAGINAGDHCIFIGSVYLRGDQTITLQHGILYGIRIQSACFIIYHRSFINNIA